MSSVYKNLIYLLTCSVNEITPDAEKIKAMDLEQLYKLAKFHTVRSAVNIALERANVKHEKFHESMKKAIRKNIYLDMERQTIFSEFEQHGIWYLPLKGSILKDLYPENGMREMADNDVLYDSGKQKEVMQIMLENGYTAESVGQSHHDVYMKPPVLNFELHTELFSSAHAESLFRYYQNPEQIMQKDSDNQHGYHFSDEDFYIFMTAHEYKHFSGSGTGIRSLLDCYVYCKVKGDSLDWNYIKNQTEKLEITDFEQKRRKLALKVFSSVSMPELTEEEQKLLMYYLTAGTYGTLENGIRKKLKDQSKAEYILHQMFPNLDYMKRSVKFVGKYPILYPAGIVYRWGRVLLIRKDYLSRMMKVLKKL
ncbi:MAG: nucleotidyltransferase family protein [Oscillospiraceae bacterium]